MHRKALAVAMTAVGVTAAIAIPTIAFGNARSDLGSFNFQKVAFTPLTAKLLGSNEVPPPGDPNGVGAASVTIDIIDGNGEVCWDLTYSNIATPPTAAIRAGAAGSNGGAIIVPFSNFGPSSGSGCLATPPAVAQQIFDAPQNFYVEIRTTEFSN